jgi:hypothetical protein
MGTVRPSCADVKGSHPGDARRSASKLQFTPMSAEKLAPCGQRIISSSTTHVVAGGCADLCPRRKSVNSRVWLSKRVCALDSSPAGARGVFCVNTFFCMRSLIHRPWSPIMPPIRSVGCLAVIGSLLVGVTGCGGSMPATGETLDLKQRPEVAAAGKQMVKRGRNPKVVPRSKSKYRSRWPRRHIGSPLDRLAGFALRSTSMNRKRIRR